MKMSKFKLAFTVLLVATIIWGAAFYYTLQGYREYCEWLDEQPWSKWDLREPYWTWNGGKYVAVTGVFLLFTWIGFIIGTLGKTLARVSERRKTVLSYALLSLVILAPIILQVGVANA